MTTEINSEEKAKREDFANLWITTHSNEIPSDSIPFVKQKLEDLPTNRQTTIQALNLKNPVIALLLSLFFGCLGIDRFYNGQIGLGIGKLLTLGGLGFWAIIDWFLIMGAVKKNNLNKLTLVI